MGFFSKLFGKSGPPDNQALVDAVYQDAAAAFKRFSSKHGADQINAFALCSVDDAAPPYIMGTTLEAKFGPIGVPVEEDGGDNGWYADPPDWCWNDEGNSYRCEEIIGAILEQEDRSFEERALQIFDGIVAGLKKFDANGKFKGRLPREEMLLLLWIHDPSNPDWVMKWATQLNPKDVSRWFKAVYPYRE